MRFMSIDLPSVVEEQLRDLAKRQNRDIAEIIGDAVRQYLEAAAITDVDPNQVAETQAELLSELPGIVKWEADDA
jgi:predicted transcriptional regulator